MRRDGLDELGLRDIEREPLGPGERLTRVIFEPTFHASVAVTICGCAADACIELAVREGEGLAVARASVGAEEIERLPPLPEGDVDLAARDGIRVTFERRDDAGVRRARATCAMGAEAPDHLRFARAVLRLAGDRFPDAAALRDVARYLG